jgi:hypothetical protein
VHAHKRAHAVVTLVFGRRSDRRDFTVLEKGIAVLCRCGRAHGERQAVTSTPLAYETSLRRRMFHCVLIINMYTRAILRMATSCAVRYITTRSKPTRAPALHRHFPGSLRLRDPRGKALNLGGLMCAKQHGAYRCTRYPHDLRVR